MNFIDLKPSKTIKFKGKRVNLFVPSMISDKKDGFETCASSFFSDIQNHKFQAFNDNPLYGCGWLSDHLPPQFIGIKLPSPKIANFMTIQSFSGWFLQCFQMNRQTVNLFVPSMKSDNQDGFETFASSFGYMIGNHKFQAFNDNPLNGCGWLSNGHIPEFIGIKLPSPKIANFMTIQSYGGNWRYSPQSFRIESSNDGKKQFIVFQFDSVNFTSQVNKSLFYFVCFVVF
jgi:hypothetical protein